MPKQGNGSHTDKVELRHVEQVRQANETKGSLVFASGDDWTDQDELYALAEPNSWVELAFKR